MAISLVHVTQGTASPLTIPSTTAGNCLIVCIGSLSGTGQSNVTAVTLGGAAGNFFDTLATGHGTDSSTVWCDTAIWCDPGCAGSQTSVAVTGASLASGGGLTVFEVSGLMTTSAVLDKKSSGGGASSGYDSGTTATTTVPNEFWAGCSQYSTTTSGPASSWTNQTAETSLGFVSGYQIVSATGTADYAKSGGIAPWAASVITLEALVAVVSRNLAINQAVNRAAVW